jgi:hypothetical protein
MRATTACASTLALLALLTCAASTTVCGEETPTRASPIPPERVRERICWLSDTQYQDDAALEKAKQYLKQAKAAGYTAVVLANSKWLAMPKAWGSAYVRRLRAVGDEARRLGIGLVPYVTNFGDGDSLLSHEPNLTEGMPVRGALFVVSGREAHAKGDPPLRIANPGFEQADGNEIFGWTAAFGNPGVSVFADSEVVRAGKRSVRMQEFRARDRNGRCWLTQSIRLTPFRQYRMTVWIKTEALKPAEEANVSLWADAGWAGTRHLCYTPLGVKPTQDWTKHQFVFNSQNCGDVLLRVGVDGRGESGKAWFDDLLIEEIGLLNVLRRPGCPLEVRGEDGIVYEEGHDFEPVGDPKLGRLFPWGGYSFTHEPPPLRLTKGSRLRDGQRLRVSFYHATAVYGHQVSICLSCPRAYELFEEGIRQVDELVGPVGYHISVGEIRTANWDKDCQERHMTPAQLLGDSIRRRIASIRKFNATARIYAWSDMFDPWHNARDHYYLCNGSWVGAWYDVPKEVVVLHWNYDRFEGQSPRFFAAHGFTQVMVGRGPDVRDWLLRNPDVPNVVGVMNFIAPSPEEFAEMIWGAVK